VKQYRPQATTDKYNHIAILIDRSGSTQSIAGGIRKQFNHQGRLINEQATASGQKTHLSLYTFSDEADHPLLFEVPLGLVSLNDIKDDDYVINGMTALFDCVGRAIKDLSTFHETTRGDHSFLVIVLTDGQENQSREYGGTTGARKLVKLMQEKIASDVWTFAFLVPKGDKANLVDNFGIPEGNVQEWDQTAKGVEVMGKQAEAGLRSFFDARAAGKKSVKSFFTDLSKVSAKQVAKALTEVTGNFKKQAVMKADCNDVDQHGNKAVVIQPFCEKYFNQYVIGNAFYSLTKTEKVQDHKTVVIEDRKSGKLYSGPDARRMLGFPETDEIRVRPGDHGQFCIYVKSTSTNRKLVEGQTLLYATNTAAGARTY
jgi:hypothetical protein